MCAIAFASVLALAASASAQSESAGVNQYFTNCASCHESNDPGHQAPKTAVLKKMTPERILEVDDDRLDAQRRGVAERSGQAAHRRMGRRAEDRHRSGRSGREDAERLCQSSGRYASRTRRPGTAGASIYRNSRFQPGAAAGLSPGQVSRLQLKWAFGFPGATALYGQTVYDGRLYVTSNAGYVYSLDAETGCLHWSFRAQSAVRSGFTIGRLSKTDPRLAIFFGDIHGTAYALSASTGEEIWKTLTDPHPLARITGTPVLFEGRLFVPVASLEEPESGQADYTCCTFRGFMSALDAATGREIWKTYTIPDVPKVVGKNSRGKDMLAPAGAGIWATPTLDIKRRALYVTTGNAFAGTPRTANAVMAMNIDTGKVLWSMQALALDTWHNGCVQNIPGGAFPARGGGGRGGRAGDLPFRIRRKTVPRCSGQTGTLRRLPRSRQPVTAATSSSRRRSKGSYGRSTRTTAR